MAEITISGKKINTDELNDRQKRILALYQEAIKVEEEFVIKLELARAARQELQTKIDKEIVNAE